MSGHEAGVDSHAGRAVAVAGHARDLQPHMDRRGVMADAGAAGEVVVTAIEAGGFWQAAAAARLRVAAEIVLPPMRLNALRQLEVGALLVSQWPASEEVPLRLGGTTLSWCEFDVMAQHVAVRLTRLG